MDKNTTDTAGRKGFWASLFGKQDISAQKIKMAYTPSSADIKEIKILGPGCAKCRACYDAVKRVTAEAGLDATIVKVDDIAEIMTYNILSTPAIVVDGNVVSKVAVPSDAQLHRLLGIE